MTVVTPIAAAVLGLALVGCAVAASGLAVSVADHDALATARGELRVLKPDLDSHVVLIAGEEALRESDALRLSVAWRQPERGPATLVVIQVDSGGTACPAMYRLIDLSRPQRFVSPKFGNCSDVPRFEQAGGVLYIVFPPYRRAAAERYRYAEAFVERQ